MKIEFGRTAEANKKNLAEWHPFYPYWPRQVEPFEYRLFEWIERKGTWTERYNQSDGSFHYWKWEYRSCDGVET